MAIDLQTISQLREKTGAGVGDCQKALVEAEGDLTKAIEILRQKGEIKAAKKSDRATKEGVIALAQAPGKVAVVAINCETDFVARNVDFIEAVNGYAQKLLTADEAAAFKTWLTEEIKRELVIKIGENLQLSQVEILTGSVLGVYLHANKKLAAVVALEGGSESLANDLAMQVAAMAPKYLSPENVAVEELVKEKEIYQAQLKQENKPEAIWDKIIAGKLNKFYEEVCLLNQIYIKDESKKVSQLLSEAGDKAAIKFFQRFQI